MQDPEEYQADKTFGRPRVDQVLRKTADQLRTWTATPSLARMEQTGPATAE